MNKIRRTFMNRRNLISSLLVFLTPMFLWGQAAVGVVSDSEGTPLVGANVVVEGTNNGGITDENGKYTIDIGATGKYNLTASFIGYSPITSEVEVGDIVGTLNFILEIDVVSMSALEVLASRADEKTPVAYTTVTKEEMEIRLGSQDIPMSLNMTPSVYATGMTGALDRARNLYGQRSIPGVPGVAGVLEMGDSMVTDGVEEHSVNEKAIVDLEDGGVEALVTGQERVENAEDGVAVTNSEQERGMFDAFAAVKDKKNPTEEEMKMLYAAVFKVYSKPQFNPKA